MALVIWDTASDAEKDTLMHLCHDYARTKCVMPTDPDEDLPEEYWIAYNLLWDQHCDKNPMTGRGYSRVRQD